MTGHRVYLPQLWNAEFVKFRKVKFNTEITWLTVSIFDHEVFKVHRNAVRRIHNLTTNRQNFEFNHILPWMVLEHMNCGHQRSLHG